MEKTYTIGNLHVLRLECYDPVTHQTMPEIDATTEKLYQAIAEQCTTKFQAACGLSFYLEIREFKQGETKERTIAIIATVDGSGNDVVNYNKGGELAILAMRQSYSAASKKPKKKKKDRAGRIETDIYMYARKEGDTIIMPDAAKVLADHLWDSIHSATAEVLTDWQVDFLGSPEEFQPLEEEDYEEDE